MALELQPNYEALGVNPTPNYAALNTVAPQETAPSWMKYMPQISGGFGALGAIFNLIQNIQRMQQMAQLRKFYKNWQEAGNQTLSRLVGDAASRGLSGSPNALAGLVSSAYAPFQQAAGQGWSTTIPGVAGPVNPFDAFLKSLEAVRSAYPTQPADTGVKFGYSSTRSPIDTGSAGLTNTSGNPMFDIPLEDLRVP